MEGNAHRVITEKAPYNPKFHLYALIPSRGMLVGFLRVRFRTLRVIAILSLSPGGKYHRVPTEKVPYNPKLMKIGLLRRWLRIIRRSTLMRSSH